MTSDLAIAPTLINVETAILAKCLLQDAWTTCLDRLAQRFQAGRMPLEEKIMLENMYTSFFYNAFYAPVKSYPDIRSLLVSTKKMLDMLKAIDEDAWFNVISTGKADQ